MKRSFVVAEFILILTTVLFYGAAGQCVLNYPDFTSVAGLTLVGNAAQVDSVLRITPSSATVQQAGAFWSSTKVPVQQGFETVFQFQITDPLYGGGDGFAFVIQNDTATALGAAGAYIGYAGIPNSLAVEFDVWENDNVGDPNGNHISIQTRGTDPNSVDHTYSLGATTNIPDMKDSAIHTVKIDLQSDTMGITFDGVFVLSAHVKLDSILTLDNGNAWVGFTAGSWTARENHDIRSWMFGSHCGTPGGNTNVVALWHFDEGSGNILHDASPYHNDGQIHNCQWVPGRFGSALHFDGLTSYVILPNAPSLQQTAEFTLEAWINPDTLHFQPSPYGSGAGILSNIGPYPCGGGFDFGLYDPGGLGFDDRSVNCVSNFSGTTPIPQAHQFYHVALVYKQAANGNNAIVKTYLNGLLTDSSVIPAPIQYYDTPNFYIGTNMDGRAVGNIGVREFPGIIDEVRISKVALDPSQFDMPHGESMVTLHVQDAGGGNAILQFGTMPGATDGLDTAFGERELPPKPPKGDFDARWLIAGTLGSLVDVEDTLGGSRPQNEYAGTAQPGPGGFPITLQWDPNSLPPGSFELVDQVSYGNGFRVNMRVQNSFVLSDTSPQPFVIVYNNTPSFVGSVFPAWNMISLPLTVPDRSVKTLFPMASSKAFAYNGGYVPVDSLAYGVGYWIKFDTVQNISVSGSLITIDTVNVAAGWNMIGTVSAPTPVGDIIQIPANNVVSQYFNYQGGYRSAVSLLPMFGYWVKVNADGKLVMNESASSAAMRPAALQQDDAGLSRLDITDAKGNAGTLYVASRADVGDRFDASRFIAPPAPPVGAFDARFGGDQLAALYEVGRTGPQQYEIDIQAVAYPVKISWNFVRAGSAVFALLDAATGKEIMPNISGTGSALVTNKAVNKLYFVANTSANVDVPGQFALEQNYPNPFNPTTMVQFALPKDAFVTIRVYSLVGQEVATLVQGRQPAGYHTAMWDASNVPSGVYFCHMVAGTYTAVRKMVLVK